MKHTFILLTLILPFISCTPEYPDNLPECFTKESGFVPDKCPSGGNCIYSIYPNSDLFVHHEESSVWMEKVEGDYLVFEYRYTKRDDPHIADDEYSESIWFKVKPTGNTFIIDNSEFKDAAVLFNRSCFCADGGFHKADAGCIFGIKKSDNSWEVYLNIETTTPFDSYKRMKQNIFTTDN